MRCFSPTFPPAYGGICRTLRAPHPLLLAGGALARQQTESGTPKEKPDAFVTRDQAAKLLKCTVRQIDRLAQRYSICKYKMSGRTLIRKADIIDTQTHPKIEVRGRRFKLDI